VRVPRCAAPLSIGVLSDYWLGDIAPEGEAPIEEHLLGCGECGRRLEWVIGLAAATRALSRRGLLRVVVGDGFIGRLAGDGLRLRQYRVRPGESVACTVTPEDDVMVARLVAPFQPAARIDLVFCDASGVEAWRLPDVAVDPARGELAFIEPIDALRELGVSALRIRIVAVGEIGDRVLGEYTFNHTPHSRA
jgi:hypothetical protein